MLRSSLLALLVGSAGAFVPFFVAPALRQLQRGRLGSVVPALARRKSAMPRGHVRLQLRMGEEVDDVTKLMEAAQDGDLKVVKELIRSGGMDVNTKQIDLHLRLTEVKLEEETQEGGTTALHLASMFGHIQVVKVLLDAGADTGVKDEDLNTPLHMAVMGNHVEIVKALTSAGADSSVENAFGDSPKVIASNIGCPDEVVSSL
jgi:ankyrin repeat protein